MFYKVLFKLQLKINVYFIGLFEDPFINPQDYQILKDSPIRIFNTGFSKICPASFHF